MTRRLPALALAALLLAACGNTATDPDQVLKDAAAAMAKVSTIQVDANFGPGASVLGFDLVAATGKVRRPDASDTTGKVRTSGGGALIQPEVVIAGGKSCLREAQFLPYHPVTAADLASFPNAGRLLDPTIGVTAALPKATGAKIAGSESVDGHDTYRVTATYAPATLNAALAPAQVSSPVQATLWIDKNDSLVRRVRLTGHLFDPNSASSVDVHLHDFNVPVTITADC